jgi:hypothetical protein
MNRQTPAPERVSFPLGSGYLGHVTQLGAVVITEPNGDAVAQCSIQRGSHGWEFRRNGVLVAFNTQAVQRDACRSFVASLNDDDDENGDQPDDDFADDCWEY